MPLLVIVLDVNVMVEVVEDVLLVMVAVFDVAVVLVNGECVVLHW